MYVRNILWNKSINNTNNYMKYLVYFVLNIVIIKCIQQETNNNKTHIAER